MSSRTVDVAAAIRGQVAGRRSLVTPEGVRLNLTLAERSDRVAAVCIDLFIILIAIISIGWLQILLFDLVDYQAGEVVGWAVAVFTVSSFLVRSFYFAFFELKWQGSTPGKRILRLRVVDRNGGPLTANAVFARNLTREIELFIPITILMTSVSSQSIGELEVWLSLGWLALFVCMPLLNRDRLRVGDMIGGTWVVAMPKPVLMPDLANAVPHRRHAAPNGDAKTEPKVSFLPEQLDVYGIYELQTLETLLRYDRSPDDETYREVCLRIRKKIGWNGGEEGVSAKEFLECYYNALRGHLETKLAFGERRKDKHHSRTR